jgi:hypothetical protein
VRFRNRRFTVGALVAVSVAVAVVLTALLQLWAVQVPVHWDLTSRGVNSLDVGTKTVLANLDQPIDITSLYYKADPEEPNQARYRQAVGDLLRLYEQENPARITTSWINPLQEQARFGELLEQLRGLPAFADESSAYAAAVDQYVNDFHPQLHGALAGFITELTELSRSDTGNARGETADIAAALRTWTQLMDELYQRLLPLKTQPLPDYSLAVENIRRLYEQLAEKQRLFIEAYADQQLQSGVLPAGVKDVLARMKQSLGPWPGRFRERAGQLQVLPPLRLRQLEQALQQSNVVVVRSGQLAKVLTFEELWPPLRPGTMPDRHDYDSRRFAGGGALTPAIFQLIENRRTAVVFTRYGGPSLFKPFNLMKPEEPPGPLVNLKLELESLNFVVTEWDLAQAQAPPSFDPAPHAVIYVVLRPGPSREGGAVQGGEALGSAQRAALLSAIHDSGRAIFLTGWDLVSPGYEYDGYLTAQWGIDVDGSTLMVSALPLAPNEWTINQQSFPYIIDVAYRESAVTSGLEAARPAVLPQATTMTLIDPPPEGVSHELLALVPEDPDIWAVHDVRSFLDGFNRTRNAAGQNITRPESGDPRPPFPAVVLARSGKERIAVVAAGEEWISDILTGPQIVNGRLVRQAPGNFALFMNLLHEFNDSLEWINLATPIDDSKLTIEGRQLALWRALIVAVWPGMALIAGVVVWFVRRR